MLWSTPAPFAEWKNQSLTGPGPLPPSPQPSHCPRRVGAGERAPLGVVRHTQGCSVAFREHIYLQSALQTSAYASPTAPCEVGQ